MFLQDKQILASKRRLASNKRTRSLVREHQTSVPLLAYHNPASAAPGLADKKLGSPPQRAAPAVDLLDDGLARPCPIVDDNSFCQERQYSQNRRRRTEGTTTNSARRISSSALKSRRHCGWLDSANSPKALAIPPPDSQPATAAACVSCNRQTNYSGLLLLCDSQSLRAWPYARPSSFFKNLARGRQISGIDYRNAVRPLHHLSEQGLKQLLVDPA